MGSQLVTQLLLEVRDIRLFCEVSVRFIGVIFVLSTRYLDVPTECLVYDHRRARFMLKMQVENAGIAVLL